MTAREQSNERRRQLGLTPLMTREEFDKLPPRSQGFVSYMQAEWPGSDLPKACIYPEGTQPAEEWAAGAFAAALEAQDSEE